MYPAWHTHKKGKCNPRNYQVRDLLLIYRRSWIADSILICNSKTKGKLIVILLCRAGALVDELPIYLQFSFPVKWIFTGKAVKENGCTFYSLLFLNPNKEKQTVCSYLECDINSQSSWKHLSPALTEACVVLFNMHTGAKPTGVNSTSRNTTGGLDDAKRLIIWQNPLPLGQIFSNTFTNVNHSLIANHFMDTSLPFTIV